MESKNISFITNYIEYHILFYAANFCIVANVSFIPSLLLREYRNFGREISRLSVSLVSVLLLLREYRNFGREISRLSVSFVPVLLLLREYRNFGREKNSRRVIPAQEVKKHEWPPPSSL